MVQSALLLPNANHTSGRLSGTRIPAPLPAEPDLDPLWLMLDLTPEGRGTDWYPKLEYDHK
jgi:hypothetical protein